MLTHSLALRVCVEQGSNVFGRSTHRMNVLKPGEQVVVLCRISLCIVSVSIYEPPIEV